MWLPANSKWLKGLIVFADVALVCIGYWFAFLLKFGGVIPEDNFKPFLTLLPAIGIVALFSFWLLGLYEDHGKNPLQVISAVFFANFLVSLGTTALAFFVRGFAFPRSILLGSIVVGTALVGSWRFIIAALIRVFSKPKSIIIIGNAKKLDLVALKFFLAHGEKYEIKGIFAIDELEEAFESLHDVDAVCIGANLKEQVKTEMLTFCLEQNKSAYLIPELYEILLHKAVFQKVDDIPILRLEGLRFSTGQAIVKRATDLCLSGIGLVVLALLLPFIWLAIQISSPGPIFYYQERIGQYGKPFKIIKFRTMVPDAEKGTGPVLATENDPRITGIGKILRATRIDELPQLVNVFKGEMSFVGPRPERQVFIDQFNEILPYYEYRLTVKPGITGLAQVLGKYDTDVADKLRYDLMYIKNYSVWLDLQLVFQTLRVVMTPSQAKGRVNVEPEIYRQIEMLKHNGKHQMASTKD
ncbi:MAG: sugar transferase [Thermacetogeniaceae bacterium]|jgi:exopolysaccharide biosynthesis polyprenyl glycosylphosphotransferase